MSEIDDLVERAIELEAEGRGAEALELWRGASEIDHRPDIMASLGRRYFLDGQYTEAESLLSETISKHPAHPNAYYYLGFLYRRTNRLEESMRFLKEGLALQEWGPADAMLGDVHRQLGQRDEARVSFQRAIAVDPNDDEAWHGLGLVTDDPGEAADAFRQAIVADPQNFNAHRELGQLYWLSGRLEEAEVSIRRALEINRQDPWGHYALGKTLSLRGLHSEAESELRLAHSLIPEDPLFLCALGGTVAKQGRLDEAEKAYKAALALDVNYYLANLRYGELLEHLGSREKAALYARRALAARPEDHRAAELLRSLNRSQSDGPTPFRQPE